MRGGSQVARLVVDAVRGISWCDLRTCRTVAVCGMCGDGEGSDCLSGSGRGSAHREREKKPYGIRLTRERDGSVAASTCAVARSFRTSITGGLRSKAVSNVFADCPRVLSGRFEGVLGAED